MILVCSSLFLFFSLHLSWSISLIFLVNKKIKRLLQILSSPKFETNQITKITIEKERITKKKIEKILIFMNSSKLQGS